MINNTDIARYLKEIKEATETDKHGGMMFFARQKMIELGFFTDMPESSLDPFRPCPAEWTAFQFAIFDNGEREPAKRKRSYIERSKVRYGGSIKVWCRDEINFKSKTQVAWKANTYLWEEKVVPQICRELMESGYIDQATTEMMMSVIEQTKAVGGTWLYSIPVLQSRDAGSRWMKGHIMAVRQDGAAFGDTIFIGPDVKIAGHAWSEQSPDGKDFDAKVVGQMRLGRHAGFDAWSTQPA